MSMSDCSACWDTPCTCGEAYKRYPKKARVELITAIMSGIPLDVQLTVIQDVREKLLKQGIKHYKLNGNKTTL